MSHLYRIAGWLGGLTGWRRYVAALCLGVLAVAAQPPFFILPALIVSFTGLVWLLDGCPRVRAALATGWWFGAGYFAAGLYWIGHAFLVDAARFGWMIPFALAGLAAYLAIYPALATAVAWRLRFGGAGRVLALAVGWAGAEWLRGVLVTGFPWNPLGNVWAVWDATLQSAALVGVYGLSFVSVFAAAACATLADKRNGAWRTPAAALLVVLAMAGAGMARLGAAPAIGADGHAAGDAPGVRLRVVQPNIAQKDKWRADLRAANLARHVALSGAAGTAAAGAPAFTHLIWPEAAVPYALGRSPDLRRALAGLTPAGGMLLTGGNRLALPGESGAGPQRRVWNSLIALGPDGAIAGVYDKHHLVPFGEYVPLRALLGLDKLTPGAVDFTPGPGPRTLRLDGLPPFSPLICYEAIFPGAVVAARTAGAPAPEWLLNITNDGWFGLSTGPYQHFASARLRAVEEGLPLVRAANTGISAVIDPFGRVRAHLPLGVAGVIDSALPGPVPGEAGRRTWFARLGNGTLGILLALGLALGWLTGRGRARPVA